MNAFWTTIEALLSTSILSIAFNLSSFAKLRSWDVEDPLAVIQPLSRGLVIQPNPDILDNQYISHLLFDKRKKLQTNRKADTEVISWV